MKRASESPQTSAKQAALAGRLQDSVAQLNTFLIVASGSEFDEFESDIKADYLFACSSLSCSIKRDFDALLREIKSGERIRSAHRE